MHFLTLVNSSKNHHHMADLRMGRVLICYWVRSKVTRYKFMINPGNLYMNSQEGLKVIFIYKNSGTHMIYRVNFIEKKIFLRVNDFEVT